jgi:2-oxo-4-hydroxy-4-carboxy--5-ureidoimidazoline (OHCU) decarboxylase
VALAAAAAHFLTKKNKIFEKKTCKGRVGERAAAVRAAAEAKNAQGCLLVAVQKGHPAVVEKLMRIRAHGRPSLN